MGIRVLAGLTLGALYGLSVAQTAAKPLRADRGVLLKKERTLQLYSQGTVIKTYKVALGGDALGPKTRQGDYKTPEGLYVLDSRNAHSQFYKSIHISYPNARDRAAARLKGVSPRCIRPWSAERLRLGRSVTPAEGLDRRMHCSHQSRDRRDLAGGVGWNAD
jgi:L,D-transpeptidase-like protein